MGETLNENLLTTGSIPKKIIMFAIPLLWGNLFQQLYNVADSLIVGNFLGNNALAAVSSSGNLIFLMVGFFGGIGVGAGVVIARYFGAGEYEKLKKAIHTALAFGGVCGIFLTVAALILAPQILKLIGTPEEVLPKSLVYFRVYFAGSLGFVIYNFGMGILQSLVDLVLIGGLGFGVGAAAFATIVSQILSAVLCIRKLRREPEAFRLSFRELRMDGNMLRLIVVNGIPAGIQNSIIAVANVFVQSNINQFGALAMAGCGSYSKIEGFGFIPVTCFSQALTTFIGQNLGAKEYDRTKKGALFGTICGIGIAEVIGIAVFFFSPYLIAAFGGDQKAIEYGIAEAHTIAFFYCLLAFSHCMAAIQRGAGRSIVPMFVMMLVWCGVRVTYISIVIRIIPVINVIYWAYPLTWFISSVIFLILFLKTDWIHGLEKQ
ncbi:MAG: MATE family efflux transporter [Coprococcus sp. 43_8]|nr:MAG: MATE family efflux transporter [Coprococcus sp. 43_8]